MMISLAAYALAAVSARAITTAELETYVRTLASPDKEGRLTLARGEEKAAAYIADVFKRAGLRAAEGNPGYIHYFDVQVNQRPSATGNVVALGLPDGKTATLKLGTDFMPLVNSRTEEVSAPLVFAGYGLKGEDWDDYAGIDVKGKVVVVFRGAPEGKPNIANRQKARVAQEQGAVGIVFVGPTAPGRSELPVTSAVQGFTRAMEFVGVGLHSKWFKPLTGLDYQQTRAMSKPMSRTLKATVRMRTAMEPNAGKGRNVIGYLPGNDPTLKNEYIIVGAHYDHLGYGEVGSRTGNEAPHFGADDNGSGTAGMMALARYFAEKKSNRRTIIFQAYGAEELGLVGSNAWAQDHPEILKATTAMLNMDMIGRVREGTAFAYGSSTSAGWDAILAQVKVPNLKLDVRPNARADSDQASFARRKVPILFFHTGLHDEYHTENDTWDKIYYRGMVDVLEAVSQTVDALDRAEQKLVWADQAEIGSRAGDRQARPGGNSAPTNPAGNPGNQGRRVRIGFIPDMASGGPGVLLAGTTPDTPAAKAGLKAGDRVLKIGDKKLDGLEDMQAAMMALEVGKPVDLVILRDGKEIIVKIVPETPAGG